MADPRPTDWFGRGAVAVAFGFLFAVIIATPWGLSDKPNFSTASISKDRLMTNANPFIGLWVTDDGFIRHEILPNGRYIEARGTREKAYQGRYALTGSHIDYVDDTGFLADGDFRGGRLYHAGMVLYRD